MSIFDISLIIILLGFTLNGLFKGIIRLVGHVIALIAGAYIASHYYLLAYSYVTGYIHGNPAVIKVLVFILVLILVIKAVSLLFILLEKIFNLVAFIPFSKYINNLLGAALGFLEGGLFLGLILFVASRYTLIGNVFGDQLASSQVSHFLIKLTSLITPLLPHALKSLQSLI